MKPKEDQKILLHEILQNGTDKTLKKVQGLEKILNHLRFEGKASLGKSLKEAREIQIFFAKDLARHIPFEEGVVFPFFKTHVPRVEPMIWLLQEEHQDLSIYLKTFKTGLDELSKAKKGRERIRILDKVLVTGNYLIYLLRNHLHTEKKYLCRIVDRELKENEKKKLAILLKGVNRGEKNANSRTFV